jgi:ankyrin repeat protein
MADEAMVLALIDHGAPLDSEVSNPKYARTRIVAGVSLMESAIRRGQPGLFNKLVVAGWINRLGNEKSALLFAVFGAGCSPALVDAAAEAGIDIDKPDPQGMTALANLVTPLRCGNREADRVATAQHLLARGANPNHRDSLGRTPLDGVVDPRLYRVVNPEMVNLLLAHGAERR